MLDGRLRAVADMVPLGASVADIGTDHAYLAIDLYKANNSRRVIASDKNAGPCQAARKTIDENCMASSIEVRQGDGLAALKAGEVEGVCIAGMGGKLIVDILAAQPSVFNDLKYAVLQPQNAQELLRGWLYDNGWHIEKETIAKADGRVYEVIMAVPGRMAKPHWAELFVGPLILQNRPALYMEHMENKLNTLRRIYEGRLKSHNVDKDMLDELEKKINELEMLIK